MGQVKECYLHYEKASDQYLGRVVAGLNCSDPAFAVLHPYFDFSSCTNPEEAEKEVEDSILSHLVCSNEVNPRLFLIFCMFFASLCYHSEFLKDTIHHKSKLQASPFFNCILMHLKSLAVVKYPWNATKYTPVFIRLPPLVSLLSKMEGLKQDFHKSSKWS